MQANILIVDDNVSLRRSMALILERKGYAVSVAGDGAEAIARATEKNVDVILMDIKLPAMNGVETYKKIKAIQPQAAVVMMTAYAVEELIQEALEEGAYGVLYKPLDMDKVIVIIEKAREATRGALIMVVDDDPGTRITLKAILLNNGYRVGVAHTGEEAIALAREAAYDVLLIDLKLPTLNGLETFLAVKQVNPQAVAIMMTGHRQEVADLAAEALRRGAYICLFKPLDMAEVLGLVEEICERKQRTR